MSGVGRELCQEEGAVEPEPGNGQQGLENGRVLTGQLQIAPGLHQGIGVQPQFGGRCRCRWNAAACQVTGQGHQQPAEADPARGIAETRQQAASQGAQENGGKGCGFHQGVATDQLLGMQMLGQDGVLHRPEQRGMTSEEE